MGSINRRIAAAVLAAGVLLGAGAAFAATAASATPCQTYYHDGSC
jgi:hypothetical protein